MEKEFYITSTQYEYKGHNIVEGWLVCRDLKSQEVELISRYSVIATPTNQDDSIEIGQSEKKQEISNENIPAWLPTPSQQYLC